MTSTVQRIDMVRVAIDDHPGFTLSRFDVDGPPPS
jgi:hypothetical protein